MSLLADYQAVDKALGAKKSKALDEYLNKTGLDYSIIYDKKEWEKFQRWLDR